MNTHNAHGNAISTSFKCSKMFFFEYITARISLRYTSYFLHITKAGMKHKINFEYTRLSPSNVVSGIQFQMYVPSMPSGIKITLRSANIKQ